LPRIIGLTGGIATGKSTVAGYLSDHYHLPIFDADLYAHNAVLPGTAGLAAIIDRYGPQILLADGTLDRPQLGEIVFADPLERKWLESVIHPHVRECFDRELTNVTNTAVAVIPLLFEANLQNMVSEVWVVTCSPQQQLDRLQNRNHLTPKQAQTRIDSQMPLAVKVRRANVVIDNSGTHNELMQQIDQAITKNQKK
jgi:dephospho-CoA kinase